jgi:transposase-like protein
MYSNIRSMVALRGGSSNKTSVFRRLAEELPAVLRRRPSRSKRRKPRQIHHRLSPKHRDQLVDEYQAGASMLSLAQRWGLHRTTVAEHLRRAGVEVKQRGIPREWLDEALRLYEDGWSCQLLAERFGCDDETVRQTLKRHGVQLRSPWDRSNTRRNPDSLPDW